MTAITQTAHAFFEAGETGTVRRTGAADRTATFATVEATPRRAGGASVAPMGTSVAADDVDLMAFDGDEVRHLIKIGNAGWSLRELGRA